MDDVDDFFRMLLDELGFEYAYVGCCMVEYPRWFSFVFRAVGLMGTGEAGAAETGDRIGAMAIGDLRDRVGRDD